MSTEQNRRPDLRGPSARARHGALYSAGIKDLGDGDPRTWVVDAA